MTREDVLKQFPDATNEQISAILKINGDEKEDLKDKIPKKADYEELVRKAEEYDKLKEADLTDAEKVQQALKDAEIAKNDFAMKSNRLDAEKILVAAGLLEEDYKDLITGIVSADAEATKTLATNLSNLLGKQKEAIEKATKEKLMDKTKTPGGAGSGKEDDEKPEDVKNAEAITFGTANKEAQTARDYYR